MKAKWHLDGHKLVSGVESTICDFSYMNKADEEDIVERLNFYCDRIERLEERISIISKSATGIAKRVLNEIAVHRETEDANKPDLFADDIENVCLRLVAAEGEVIKYKELYTDYLQENHGIRADIANLKREIEKK